MDDTTNLHHQPTPEELQAGIDKAIEEASNPDPTPEVDEPEVPVPPIDTIQDPLPDTNPDPTPEPTVEPEEQEPEIDKSKLEKMYGDSTREAQILTKQTQRYNDVIEEAANLPEPSDEEMTVQYRDWEIMDDVQKQLAKAAFLSNKRFEMIREAQQEGKNTQEWYTKVDQYAEDPKTLIDFPDLEGKVEEFKIFASKGSRRGLPLEEVVGSFLYDFSKNLKPSKGKLFETGTGGTNEKVKPKSDKITVEQSKVLMETNYKKYLEYLNAGKIEDVI